MNQKNVSSFRKFYQTHSHNLHFRITRLELNSRKILQTHSHNMHSKISGLVRRFSGRRNCPPAAYIVVVQSLVPSLKTELCNWLRLRNVEGNSLSFPPPWEFQTPNVHFESPRPLSPPWGPWTSYQSAQELTVSKAVVSSCFVAVLRAKEVPP